MRGPVGRDVIAGVTSLSIATVNRQVIALLDAGLLRERADLAVSGAIGRPRVPGGDQPRTVRDAGHPHRRAYHQHRGHRPVRPHAGHSRDPDAAQPRRARAGVACRERVPVPEALAPAPPAVGRGGDRRHRRQRHRPRRPPEVGLATGAGRAGAGRRAGPAVVGGLPRRRHGRRRAAARPAAIRAEFADQSLCLRPRDRGLCPGDRGTGALPGQRPGDHRVLARPLRAARRQREAGVHRQRRSGSGRCPPAESCPPSRRRLRRTARPGRRRR